jgi:hypothetical protein
MSTEVAALDSSKLFYENVAAVQGTSLDLFIRGHPWEIAMVAGVAVGALVFLGIRKAIKAYRRYRMGKDISRFSWDGKVMTEFADRIGEKVLEPMEDEGIITLSEKEYLYKLVAQLGVTQFVPKRARIASLKEELKLRTGGLYKTPAPLPDAEKPLVKGLKASLKGKKSA